MADQDFNEDERIEILIENTAQGILNDLKDHMASQARARTRWGWELLQNARDAGADVVSVKHDEDKVVFWHNGDGFTRKEVGHLIHYGSTKTEDNATIGQYGSGFLTTHLLSPEIRVSGSLEDGQRFRFRLIREITSVNRLAESLKQAWRDFQNSLTPPSASGGSGTEFIYPLNSGVSNAAKVVESGIAMLKLCAPFAVVFNDEFSSIEIKSRSETTAYKRRSPLSKERGLHKVVIEETVNGIRRERRYVVAQGEIAQVAIPLETNGGDTICAPIREIPKLFLGFPLIGTEDFGFPAVINSLKFTPTENRDGVYAGQNDNNAANIQNEKIIEEACGLLVELIDFAAESGWRNICELARVPHTVNYNRIDKDWFKGRVNTLFVEKIREKAIALNGAGERIPPDALKLPFAETAEGALTLWDLLADWKRREKVLPRRDEAAGWRDAVQSWAEITMRSASSYRETVDGDGLAKIVHNASPASAPLNHRVRCLNLKKDVDPIRWLDRLIGFLLKNGFRDSVLRQRIVPSQSRILHPLPRFLRDKGIDEELKDIAHLAHEWRIRPKLRDVRVVSLKDEIGAGDWNNEDAARFLIDNLNARAVKNPDKVCFEASKRLFAWIVGREDWDTLRTLPVFSAEYESANRQTARDTLKLGNSPTRRNLPLAPVASWEEALQPYSELFPMRHTLADFYFDAISDSETWDALAREGFVRNGVIVKYEDRLNDPTRFHADDLSEEDDHLTAELVPVTDIAFRTGTDIGIMARARQSRSRARLFWRFVTEWLIHKDPDGLEVKQASCICGEEHGYYPAEWIAPLHENKWIPIEGTRSARQANAQSLADLLRGGEWTLASLDDNPAAVKLLEAIGVTQFDLTRSFMAETAEKRAKQDEDFTKIMIASDGDLGPVSKVAEYMNDDPGLFAHIVERQEHMGIVHRNQCLGAHVEDLVRQSLESEGFIVKRTGIGSDFEIEPDDAARLELAHGDKSWLIEVKATTRREVHMTYAQAITAERRRDGFLLCVVPIDSAKPHPELEDVRASMRFVSDIGARLDEPMQRLRDFRVSEGKVAAYYSDGVQLVVDPSAPRVSVANTVWENDGFPLDDLRGKLT